MVAAGAGSDFPRVPWVPHLNISKGPIIGSRILFTFHTSAPFTLPPRPWQRSLMRAIRLTFPKPESSAAITPMLARAAGLRPTDPFPSPPWMVAFLRELREQWGFPRAVSK